MSTQDGGSQPPAYVDALLAVCATACFVLAHFHIGDFEVVFWLGVTFNLMLIVEQTS
jgi:hypothetical protein